MASKLKESDFINAPITPQASRILGKQFSKITVIRFMGKDKWGVYHMECICICGNKTFVSCSNIEKGNTTSCGCFKKESRNATHGDANWVGKKEKSKIYAAWQGVKARCFYPSNPSYNRYGAIGTTMCVGYKENYPKFKKDLGGLPSPEHTVDRISSYGHYSCGECKQCKNKKWPMNIRWADEDTQNNNKRNTVYVTVGGVKMGVSQFERKMGYRKQSIYIRLKKGWSEYDAINTPVIPRLKP